MNGVKQHKRGLWLVPGIDLMISHSYLDLLSYAVSLTEVAINNPEGGTVHRWATNGFQWKYQTNVWILVDSNGFNALKEYYGPFIPYLEWK